MLGTAGERVPSAGRQSAAVAVIAIEDRLPAAPNILGLPRDPLTLAAFSTAQLERARREAGWKLAFAEDSATHRVNQLAACFNRAGWAVVLTNGRFDRASVECIETMGHALDVPHTYVAGDSNPRERIRPSRRFRHGLAGRGVIRAGPHMHGIGKLESPTLRPSQAPAPEDYELVEQLPPHR